MSEILDQLTAALAEHYRIERELGAGGMATVYLAEDLKHQRRVAIKVLRPELAAAIGTERFLREITTTANLRHPHILPLYDSGRAGGRAGRRAGGRRPLENRPLSSSSTSCRTSKANRCETDSPARSSFPSTRPCRSRGKWRMR